MYPYMYINKIIKILKVYVKIITYERESEQQSTLTLHHIYTTSYIFSVIHSSVIHFMSATFNLVNCLKSYMLVYTREKK